MQTATELAHPVKTTAGLRRLMRGFSLEATFPSRAELELTRGILAPATPLYLSLPRGRSVSALCDVARDVRLAGFEPVPHIPARACGTRPELEQLLARLDGDAGVTRALVIAGDCDQAGPFADALALIETDLFERHRYAEIAIAAYPDGHPKISEGELTGALTKKLDAIYARGLSAHIVTQFCFDADRIVAWLRQLRYLRVDVPVKLGIAGPASAAALLRYALKCGVRASIRGMQRAGAARLVADSKPDALIGTLSRIDALSAGSVTVHLFSFGGLAATARWANAAAAGEIDLAPSEAAS